MGACSPQTSIGTIALAGLLACSSESPSEEATSEPQATVVVERVPSAPPPTGAPVAPKKEYEPEALPDPDGPLDSLETQRERVVARMRKMGVITSAEQAKSVAAIMSASKHIGQGNPVKTKHPMTRMACVKKRKEAGVREERKPMCPPFMAPVYDPSREVEDEAEVCIDRYEFPGLPCEYPVTWATTKQAAALCDAIGKRLCDAHEWEGACAGKLRSVADEYRFGWERPVMRNSHNNKRPILWAYGGEKDHLKCGTQSRRSPKCYASGWKHCGSNTYPSGAFPACRSRLGVYDQHGNAAEHMWLPMKPEAVGTNGTGSKPEMKGSWFIFAEHEAHTDDCRWRAPAWHDNEGRNHANYHLGFRCCADVVR
ncbi:MAG: SUMF1/EgtB/PvdO family nonheme iron enzyme [Myxococcota bacterium]